MALRLGVQLRTILVSANYTVTNFDDIVGMDASTGNKTITLPDATTVPGKAIKLYKSDSSTNLVTISGAQTINGLSNWVLAKQNDEIELASVNGVWVSIGQGYGGILASVYGAKNYAMNGNFDIWQRGTSNVAAGTNAAFYRADRWKITSSNTGITASINYGRSAQGVVPTGAAQNTFAQYSVQLSCATAQTTINRALLLLS